MKEPVWLGADTIIDIHGELIAHFGGRPGLRDRGALDAALDRPRNKLAYGETRLAHLAAAYAFGLTRGHAFIDGNKRIGFAAMLVFLGLNGRALRAPEPEATALMFALAAGEVGEEQAADWISRHCEPPT